MFKNHLIYCAIVTGLVNCVVVTPDPPTTLIDASDGSVIKLSYDPQLD